MEKRAAVRYAIGREAECRSCGRTWTSLLSNISSTGCMVASPEPALPDEALVRLRLKGLTAIDGAIVWQNEGYLGIRFLEPLHAALLRYLGAAVEPTPCESPAPGPEAGGPDAAPARRLPPEEPPQRIAAGG